MARPTGTFALAIVGLLLLTLSGCTVRQQHDSTSPRPADMAGRDQPRRSVDEERLNAYLERRDLQEPAPWDAPRDRD